MYNIILILCDLKIMTFFTACYDELTSNFTNNSAISYTATLPSRRATVTAIKVYRDASTGVKNVSLFVEMTTDGETYADVTERANLPTRNATFEGTEVRIVLQFSNMNIFSGKSILYVLEYLLA